MSNYIDRGYELVFKPPFVANNVGFYGFILKAEMSQLQKFCDRYFNDPIGRPGAFTPAGDFLMLACCSLPSLQSTTPPYDQMGNFAENEFAFWVPVIDHERERMLWSFPYIWVDNPFAMAMGRELYGFPKGLGTITIPDDPKSPDLFRLDTLGVRTFSPDAVGEIIPLVTVNRASANDGAEEDTIFSDIKEMIHEIVNVLEEGYDIFKHIRLALHTIEDLLHMRMPMVFLNQFRDVADPATASVQSLIETSPGANKIHSGRLYGSTFEVTIEESASAPIISDLGLETGRPITPLVSYYMNFDFEIGLGKELWKRSQVLAE